VGNIDVLGKPEQWFSTAVCDPRIAGSCTSAPSSPYPSPRAVCSTWQLAAERDHRPDVLQYRFVLIKKTKVGGATLEFRAEAFKRLQPPELRPARPHRYRRSTSFGVITGTRFPTGDSGVARQLQFALKVLF
jgi:hypothetical protein